MRFYSLSIMFSLVFLIVAIFFSDHLWTVFGILAFTYSSILLWGIFDLRIQLFVKATVHSKNGVLLTFDDGPDAERTPAILDLLRKKKISALFFVIGNQVEKHPEMIKRIVQEGHVVGGHSYSHNLRTTFYSTRSYLKEIDKCNEAIEKVTGITNNVYRPPFGITDPSMGRALKIRKTKTIGWSVRSLDTKLTSKNSLSRLKRRTRKDSIVLLHDNGILDVKDLEGYIDHCIQKEYAIANPVEFIEDLHDA